MTVLQLFLSSSKPVLRFAAVRTLNRVAMTHPMAVTNCNIDMESPHLATRTARIATLAITTLLKTGAQLPHALRHTFPVCMRPSALILARTESGQAAAHRNERERTTSSPEIINQCLLSCQCAVGGAIPLSIAGSPKLEDPVQTREWLQDCPAVRKL